MSMNRSRVFRCVRWTALFAALVLCLGFSVRAMAGKDQQGSSLQGMQISVDVGDWLEGTDRVVMDRDGILAEIVDLVQAVIEAIERHKAS